MVGFDLGPLLEGQMRTAKLKSAYNSLVLVHCLYGGYNLHRFSDALGLVLYWNQTRSFICNVLKQIL